MNLASEQSNLSAGPPLSGIVGHFSSSSTLLSTCVVTIPEQITKRDGETTVPELPLMENKNIKKTKGELGD
jgi:hypothetical protein